MYEEQLIKITYYIQDGQIQLHSLIYCINEDSSTLYKKCK